MKTLRASSGDGEVALNDVLDSAAPTVCAPGLDTEARDGPVNNGDVVAEHNPEHPTVEKRELRAWYSGDFASSVFHHVSVPVLCGCRPAAIWYRTMRTRVKW